MAKRTRNAGSGRTFYTIANRAPMTGAGGEQLACFFRGLSFNAGLTLHGARK
jgi:hypothetical protein